MFWRQGACTKGDACGYVHGNSQVPCTQFASASGCRFGDKCAFKHHLGSIPGAAASRRNVSLKKTRPTRSRRTPRTAGARDRRPSRYLPVAVHCDSDGEEGEMRVVEGNELLGEEKRATGLLESETSPDSAEHKKGRARDAVLAACAVIASPAMEKTWRAFADPEVRRAQRSGPAPAPYKRA